MAEGAEQKPEAGEEPEITIDKLPDSNYVVVKPIPVNVSYEDSAKAHVASVDSSAAGDLSMLFMMGQGETEAAAKYDFAKLVVESFMDMEGRKDELEGPEKTLYENLCRYIQPGEGEPEAEAPAEEPALAGGTCIESLPKDCGYELVKPIPVKVEPDEDGDGFVAKAPDLALLEKGIGQKPWTAIDYLTKCILDQCDQNAADKAAGRELVGVAKLVDERLAEYLRPVEQKPEDKPAEK
jgi:hypothetical protein